MRNRTRKPQKSLPKIEDRETFTHYQSLCQESEIKFQADSVFINDVTKEMKSTYLSRIVNFLMLKTKVYQ